MIVCHLLRKTDGLRVDTVWPSNMLYRLWKQSQPMPDLQESVQCVANFSSLKMPKPNDWGNPEREREIECV